MLWLSLANLSSKENVDILNMPLVSEAANLLLVAGGITMVTGFLGCLGALKEQRCLLFMFFGILLLLVLTEMTLVLVIHMFHDKLDSKAQGELKEGMKIYKSDPGLKTSWDNVQKMFKCCGVTNKTDWYDVLNGTLPSSCCSVGMDQCVDGWSEPCYQKARQWLLTNIPSVLVFGVCIGVVQLQTDTTHLTPDIWHQIQLKRPKDSSELILLDEDRGHRLMQLVSLCHEHNLTTVKKDTD
ncbi:hypothetical protein F2P81_014474 [Scophthalmus maximus]|uniref:Uncharacterized protein n=1 Tax=Scophthalmus maximus TaxID=52904 RepID=A0A6A4SM88_SCOMX|nr:hypothetical protein F2P81_014474 [Scophthalmus maximus]